MSDSGQRDVWRVGILFSGGPAPAANAVIAAAAISFLEEGREVVGFFHGYSNLAREDGGPLEADVDYRELGLDDVRGIRNARGIILGTARTDPARAVRSVADLTDPGRASGLARLHARLEELQIDALISIGGDGSLRIAHLYASWQSALLEESRRVRVVHLPKTIDNDYPGIDFTFGYFTAVDVLAKAVENLGADASATSSWFIVETMGRRAGWLSYGVAIAGEADLVLAAEDVDATLTVDGEPDGLLDLERLGDRIIDAVLSAERRGKHHGVMVVAEGLAERLPTPMLDGAVRHEHGQIAHGSVDLARLLADHVGDRYRARTGRRKRFKAVQLGYEGRSAPPHAVDVMLGSQLGIGAYRALVEEGLDAHMVSVSGQLDLRYVPFTDLVDPHTGVTCNRPIEPGSDLWRLARLLEARSTVPRPWAPGRRREP